MADDEFRVHRNWTLGQCHDRITVLEGEKEQLTTELTGTKFQLDEVTRERDTAWAKVARGIVHNKNRDWDDPPEVRQSWLEWWESKNFLMEHIVTAYRKSCVENNINSGLKKKSRHALRYVELDAVRHRIGLLVDPEENFEMDKHFPFQRLIQELPEVAHKIAVMTMYKGSVIHFIARLDRTEAYPPRQPIDITSGLPMRFWWGPGKSVHINSAPKIHETLAPLYVCRDFAEIFGNAFWSQNKFSFASFGELHIFRRNTRRSYIERIVQIELWWQGSKNALPIDFDPETVERFDHRTWPLSVLTWMKRLKILEVYVDESSNMRRSNEPEDVRDVLAEATRGINHENNRQLRDLRKLHGTDYLYQLRGMRKIRFYDSNQPEKREQVVDDSFVRDMRAQITQRKSRLRGQESRLENLKPLFRRGEGRPAYERSREVEWIIRSLFNPKLKWEKWKDDHPSPNNGAGDGGGGDDTLEDGNGGGGENPGHGDNGPQNRDGNSDSDSDSSDDSDTDPESLFVHQPNLSGVVSQPSRFHGRRYMGRGANGSPTHGFAEAIEIDSDHEDDDDIVVDEDRSAPANRRGMQIDPQLENAAGNYVQSQEPKPDEDVNMPDVYGASPGLEDGVARPPGPNMILQMSQNGGGQAQDVQVPDAEIADPQDALAASVIFAQPTISDARESPMPSFKRPEQPIIIDLDDYDDDVQFIEARFEPIKIEDDSDEDLPPQKKIFAKSRTSNNSSSAPTHGNDVDVKVEDSASARAGSFQGTPKVMREVPNLRRSLTPAGRYVTPDPYATPSSSRAADEDELVFDTPTSEARRASDPRRDWSSSFGDNASVRSSASSSKKSRGEDASTPRPVDIGQMVSPSSRSSRSSGICSSLTREVDELDLRGNQHDGARDFQPSKRRRGSPKEKS